MFELFRVVAVCAYLWPAADVATNEMCYVLVSTVDESKIKHMVGLGNLFLVRPAPNKPQRKRPSPLKIFHNSRYP